MYSKVIGREIILYIHYILFECDIAKIHTIDHVYAALSSIKMADWRF